MYCYYHPELPAVAQCANCGKGLCPECASRNSAKIPLCPTCAKRSLIKSIWTGIVYFAVLGIVYYIGYQIGMHMDRPDPFLGWMFVFVWTGLCLMSGKMEIPWMVTWFAPTAGCFLLVFKFMLATVIGAILLIPIALWNIFCLLRNIYYLWTWSKVKD